MSFLKTNAKIIVPVGILVGVLAIGSGVLGYQINSDKIANNVIVADVDLSKLTKEQATIKLNKNEKFKKIILKHRKLKWDVDPGSLNLKIDFDKTVEDAYMVNRNGSIFSNMYKTMKADFGSKSIIPLVMTYDKDKLNKKLIDIKAELDSPVKNATMEYKDEKTVVVPDEPGRTMNVLDSAKKVDTSLKKDKFTIDLAVKLKEAKFKAVDLKGIDSLLASYSTSFGGMQGRDYNIKKSAEDSGGIVLKPGDEFSFNGLTGDKTIANGYKYAPVIESGKLVLGCGGGVCQTSSTIFNTALLSGMEITNRRNHTIPSDYVSLGRDATVYDGNPGQDFKFKNPFKNNIYLKNFVYEGKIYSQIYGSKKDMQNIEISTQMLGSRGAGSKTIQDPTLPAGRKVIEKYSRPGYTVVTYRIYKDKSGKTIKTEKIGISSYPAQMGIVRVGSKPAAPKPKAVPSTPRVVPQQTPPPNSQAQGQ